MLSYLLLQRSYRWSLFTFLLLLLFFWWTTALKSQSFKTVITDDANLFQSLSGQMTPMPALTPISTLTPTPVPTPASKPVLPFALTWEYQLSFNNGNLNAHWVMKNLVQVQTTQNITTSIAVEIDIDCDIVGNVTITGSQANFDGGYISCPLPNFQNEVNAYIQNLAPDSAPDERWTCVCNFKDTTPPWVAAKFKQTRQQYHIFMPLMRSVDNPVLASIHAPKPASTPVLTSSEGSPLVYLQGGFEYQVGTNGGQEYTELVFHGEDGQGQESITNTHAHTPSLWATTFSGFSPEWVKGTLQLTGHHEFLDDLAFHNIADLHAPKTSFLGWPSISSMPPILKVNAIMNPNPPMIYIGGHPNTASRFKGSIKKISVDPGCRGGGG